MSADVINLADRCKRPVLHVDIVPVAEECGPYMVLVRRDGREIAVGHGLNLAPAVSLAVRMSLTLGIPLGPDAKVCRDNVGGAS